MRDETPLASNGDEPAFDRGWRKSSYSMSNGHCIEIACLGISGVEDARRVAVRDSEAGGAGPVLRFESRAWAAFVAGLQARSTFKG
jgi:Domain of unknown function (DUF397)